MLVAPGQGGKKGQVNTPEHKQEWDSCGCSPNRASCHSWRWDQGGKSQLNPLKISVLHLSCSFRGQWRQGRWFLGLRWKVFVMRVVEQVVQRTGGCPIPGNIPGIFQFVLCTDFQALSSLICWRSLPMQGLGGMSSQSPFQPQTFWGQSNSVIQHILCRQDDFPRVWNHTDLSKIRFLQLFEMPWRTHNRQENWQPWHTQSRESKIMNLAGARRDPKDPLSRALHDQTRESISEEEVNPKPSSNPKSISLRDTFPPGRNDCEKSGGLVSQGWNCSHKPQFLFRHHQHPLASSFLLYGGNGDPCFSPRCWWNLCSGPLLSQLFYEFMAQDGEFLNMACSKLILALWNQHLNFTINRENCLLW